MASAQEAEGPTAFSDGLLQAPSPHGGGARAAAPPVRAAGAAGAQPSRHRISPRASLAGRRSSDRSASPAAAALSARASQELAEFREIFNLVDLDKGGTISKDELKQLMTTLGLKPSQEELNAMVEEIDADKSGEIDFDEFVTVMSRKVNTSYTPAQVKAAFKVFEKEAPSGFMSMAALEQALTTYGTEKLSLSDAQELLSQIEPDENGMVNYVEFVNMMTSS